MVIAVFRVRHRTDADHAAEAELGGHLYGLVSQIPGFLNIKDFRAADGEVVNLVEFENMEALEAWRDHPEHIKAKQRGGEFYQTYQLQVCDVIRTYGRSAE